jgi:FAD:protein FMN transferase
MPDGPARVSASRTRPRTAFSAHFSIAAWLVALAANGCWNSSARPADAGRPAAPTAATASNIAPAAALRPPSEWLADNASTAAGAADLVTRARALMGTIFRVMVVSEGDRDTAGQAAEMVLDEAARLERMMSEWKPGSALSSVNDGAGTEAVEVPPELFEVMRSAIDVAIASDGAFDPSWAGLWELWRFDRPPRVPSRDEVAARLPLVNYRDVVLDAGANSAFLRKRGMLVGLGGIAKGYSLDRGAALLRAKGFHNFILYGGGQVYASGTRGPRPWRVGIQDPRNSERWFAVLELRNASLSTSGDYEHFFVVDGVRYHHILDLRTGFPAHGCRSATVIAPDGTTADALSTATFVLGPKRGLRVIRRFAGAEGVVVDDENRVHISEGLREKILVGPPTP